MLLQCTASFWLLCLCCTPGSAWQLFNTFTYCMSQILISRYTFCVLMSTYWVRLSKVHLTLSTEDCWADQGHALCRRISLCDPTMWLSCTANLRSIWQYPWLPLITNLQFWGISTSLAKSRELFPAHAKNRSEKTQTSVKRIQNPRCSTLQNHEIIHWIMLKNADFASGHIWTACSNCSLPVILGNEREEVLPSKWSPKNHSRSARSAPVDTEVLDKAWSRGSLKSLKWGESWKNTSGWISQTLLPTTSFTTSMHLHIPVQIDDDAVLKEAED